MKKILAMLLSVAIIASIAIGGTVAYLSDQDGAVNTMTAGTVFVEQYEQERVKDANGKGVVENGQIKLQEFTQNQQMVPAVYGTGDMDEANRESVKVGDYTVTMYSGARVKNYVDKIVTAKNTGTTDAYVRTIIAIPMVAGFDSGDDAGQEWLHWNYPRASYIGEGSSWTFNKSGAADSDEYVIDNVTIEGKLYSLHVATNKNRIEPDETTAPSMVGFYIDKRVDNEKKADGSLNYTMTNSKGDFDLGDISDLKILVMTQAVQADGFADAWTALDEAFGDITSDNHPWKNGIDDPAAKARATELANQLKALKTASGAKTITLESGATYDFSEVEWESLYLTNSVDITIEGNNATITGLKAPLFGEALVNITIKDLTISGANMVNTSTNNVNMTCAYGAFIQYTTNKNITLSNCHLKNSTITSTQKDTNGAPYDCGLAVSGDWVGGMVGYISEGTAKFENCTVENCTIKGNESVGGIIGNAGGGNAATNIVTFNNCSVSGNSKLHSDKNGSYRIGAIVGSINGTATMTSCSETGTTLEQTSPTVGRFVFAGAHTGAPLQEISK